VNATVSNARCLAREGGVTARERLSDYLEGADVRAAAALADASVLILDAQPGEASEALDAAVAALSRAGAFARVTDARLIAVATRVALDDALAESGESSKRALQELLRAFDAAHTRPQRVRLRDRELDLAERAHVMGILNVTPDSFYDRGRYSGVDAARARAAEMVELGASTGTRKSRRAKKPSASSRSSKRCCAMGSAFRSRSTRSRVPSPMRRSPRERT
jgi:hypothetical protein